MSNRSDRPQDTSAKPNPQKAEAWKNLATGAETDPQDFLTEDAADVEAITSPSEQSPETEKPEN